MDFFFRKEKRNPQSSNRIDWGLGGLMNEGGWCWDLLGFWGWDLGDWGIGKPAKHFPESSITGWKREWFVFWRSGIGSGME
jgi:hypothetical protein